MPPSPARRSSPGRELRLDHCHKRVRSVDRELPCKSKDEDLTLFTDMQKNERKNNLLLLSNEDFDVSLAKLKCETDYPFGMRGGSNDILNPLEKVATTDYDWLLTPPETPLFPYLDDDEPPPANLSASRGSLRGQGMASTRASMGEKNQRSRRSNASPHRLSQPSRSSNTAVQSRGRSPSSVQSSSSHVARSATPSRRSPTPSKPSNPTPRSSTPTPRRTSVDSSLQTSSSARRGTSPMKGSRGGSASPKLQGWQSNIPGLPSDAPPNLRTHLSDRPSSYSRGSSPASRNSRARQSTSPTTSRSASSSYSYDPDHVSPQSKDSTTSFADEDVDSLPSVSMGSSPSPIGRKNGASNKSGFSRKPSRTVMANSTPKRSLDSTLQQMDQRQTTQKMFRPLLSDAPLSSFYIGKAGAMHRPVFSRNSSFTTSSNTSSEVGARVAPEHEGTSNDTTYNVGEWDGTSDPLLHEGFVLEKLDDIKEDITHDLVSEKPLDGREDFCENTANGIELDDSQKSCSLAESVTHPIPHDDSNDADSHDQIGCLADDPYVKTCSICRKAFSFTESSDQSVNICEDCIKKAELYDLLLERNALLSSHEENVHQVTMSNVINGSSSEMQLVAGPEISEETNDKDMAWKLEGNSEQFASQIESHREALDCLEGSCDQLVTTNQKCRDKKWEVQQPSSMGLQESSLKLASNGGEHLDHEKPMVDQLDNDYRSPRSPAVRSNSSPRVHNSEGTAMPVLLLKRSSSSKGPYIHTRNFTAANLPEETTYTRENTNVVKESISRNISSVSSLDFGPPGQVELHVHRQSSTRKDDPDFPNDFNAISCGPTTSSGISSRDIEEAGHGHLVESDKNRPAYSLRHDSVEKDGAGILFEETDCKDRHFSSVAVNSIGDDSQTEAYMQRDGLSGSSTVAEGASKMDSSVAILRTGHDFLCDSDTEVEPASCIVTGKDKGSFDDAESQISIHNDEQSLDCTRRCSSSISLDTPTIGSMECMKIEYGSYQDSTVDMKTSHSRSHSLISQKELSAPAIDYEEDISAAKELAAMIEDSFGRRSRSLTLTEATDAILFCSSIVHDLAYKAASIGIENEESSTSKPVQSAPHKPVYRERERAGVVDNHTTKPQHVRRNTSETNIKKSQEPEPIQSENSHEPQESEPLKSENSHESQESEPLKSENSHESQESEPLKSEKTCDSPKPDPVPQQVDETPKTLAKAPPKPPSKCNCTIM